MPAIAIIIPFGFALIMMINVSWLSASIYFKVLDEDLKVIQPFLSKKSFLFFYVANQKERQRTVTWLWISHLIIGAMLALHIPLIATTNDFYKPWPWVYVLINLLLPIISWIAWSFFKKAHIDKVKANVKQVDLGWKKIAQYHLISHPQLDSVLHFRIKFFLTKRLLNDVKRTKHPNRSIVWIYQVLRFYARIYQQTVESSGTEGAKNNLLFANQQDELSFSAMLKLISDCLDRWDVDIKIIRTATQNCKYVETLMNDQNTILKPLMT